MSEKIPTTTQVIITVLIAIVAWAIIFGLKIINFWLGLSVSTTILAFLSVLFGGNPLRKDDIRWWNLKLGILSAVVLYGVFYIGNMVALKIFPFAGCQISKIYAIQHEGTPVRILFTLLLVTSPAEEVFWRGFLQRWLVHRIGSIPGWLGASFIYGIVHIWSGNIMLTLAALVAGLFWGGLYAWRGNLSVCIISHMVWTSTIFIFFPIGN